MLRYNFRTNFQKKLLIILIIFLIGLPVFYYGSSALSQNNTGNSTIEGLNDGLIEIRDKIKELEKQKSVYEDEISELQSARVTLNRELGLLDNRIAQKEVEIKTEEARIAQTQIEIQTLDFEIEEAEKEIEATKLRLGYVLDKLNREDVVDYFEILLLNDNFADFFTSIKSLENIQGDVYQLVNEVKVYKETLEEQQEKLVEKKEFQEKQKLVLEEKRVTLLDQQGTKAYLVSETRLDERRFQGLIAQIRREQAEANADIVSLEKEIRSQLQKDQLLSTLGGDEVFKWPVDSQLITARFRDPSYPYRHVFEHSAIDIAIPQGSPIRATKTGYVGRAKDAGQGYSYILLIHDEGISSVYGHVSSIHVSEDDFVVQGQVIGLSGGQPGSPGAGSFSTGSHLHFELRQDGIPINPENYL